MNENIPVYFLCIGVLFWGIAMLPLSGSVANCGGMKPKKLVLYKNEKAVAVKRAGPWGESCNYWIEHRGKEIVVNIKDIARAID